MKKIFIFILAGYFLFCGWLVVESGLFAGGGGCGQGCILLQQAVVDEAWGGAGAVVEQEPVKLESGSAVSFGADSAAAQTITLGSVDPESGFKFRLELSSRGAAIEEAIFSEFDDRDYKNPQPLVILSPVPEGGGREIFSMANSNFVFVEHELKLPLDRLHWQSFGMEKASDGSESARFEAVIKTLSGEPVIKLTKRYKVSVDSYHLDCDIAVENLSRDEQKVRFDMFGPVGLGREGVRSDMRKVAAGFRDLQGQMTSVRIGTRKLRKAKSVEGRRLIKPGANFLWAAAANKYFAAILVPVAEQGKGFCDWVTDKTGRFYNPDGDSKADSGDETVGVDLKVASRTLAAAGQAGSGGEYHFLLYLGPKDKSLFDKNELYRGLGFVQVIDFMPCFCCPAAIINPLAFGILALMKWMYGFIGNYGVVIIILVFLVRLVVHPVTKKSQVSMSKMSKLAPQAEAIKKKYANNKAEMNKHLMALYKEQGASPVMGMLPMFVQMPVWIALYSAINASIELRGAPFLPFWITDLSAPDAAVRFATVTIPLLGWKINSLNLLPILMGVAFYLQQKLMPSQASAASSNPQLAQQQKMMMVMMPILFPVMLYKAPSGLNLYIMASVSAGVVEQYVIRKHIREKEQAEASGLVAVTSKTGGRVKKKKPKPFYKT